MRLDRYCHIELVAAAVHFLQQFPEPFGHPSAGLLPGGERNLLNLTYWGEVEARTARRSP